MKVEITRIGGEECAVCSSLDIAETFGKNHYNIMRDIRNLDCSEKFRLFNFEESEYVNEQGHNQPCCIMTRDGFTFLVMGYTGEKAAQFKEAYIEQFNRMERELRRKQMETLEPALRRLLDTLQTMCGDPGKEVLALPMASDLFKYFNGFQQWLTEESPSKDAAFLYMNLFCTFNLHGWSPQIPVDTCYLMSLTRTADKKTAFRARDELVEAGLLEYKPGKKGKPSSYRLLVRGAAPATSPEQPAATPPTISDKNPEETPPAKLPEKPQPKQPTEPKPQPEKAKPKPKKRAAPAPLDVPNAPPRHDIQQERFDIFWQEYPRKVGKKAALTAWKKLKPNDELFERILYAVRQAKKSHEWQKDNGQYIPHPSRWLNEGRWDDELPPAPATSANNTKGELINGNYREGNSPNGDDSTEKRDFLGLPVL